MGTNMTSSLAKSYAYCEKLARRQAGNFYHGFRFLPLSQRQAMCALYAFLRVADDIGDSPGEAAEKKQALDRWRVGLDGAIQGRFEHPLHEALRHTIQTHQIPLDYLHEVLDGVAMDLQPMGFETFGDLRLYCYRVASAVGLACIHIWGFTDPQAKNFAENAGLAFQLTNILRDLKEDTAQGRYYIPREDLQKFHYPPENFRLEKIDESFRNMMRFQVERARNFFQASVPLLSFLYPTGRAVFLVMARTYRSLLDLIEQKNYDVFSNRVSLSRWKKWRLALGAWPVRWGWFSPEKV